MRSGWAESEERSAIATAVADGRYDLPRLRALLLPRTGPRTPQGFALEARIRELGMHGLEVLEEHRRVVAVTIVAGEIVAYELRR